MTTTIAIIGFAAGFITTFALLPEIIRVWQIKETKDLSMLWLVLITFGDMLWAYYGFAIGSWPILGSNIVSCILSVFLLSLKFKYK